MAHRRPVHRCRSHQNGCAVRAEIAVLATIPGPRPIVSVTVLNRGQNHRRSTRRRNQSSDPQWRHSGQNSRDIERAACPHHSTFKRVNEGRL